MYEGMKGVSKRNKVFLSEKDFIAAESVLNSTPMLPSIVCIGTANKVHVWAFESNSDEDLAIFADHAISSIVSGISICIAPSWHQNVLKSLIISGGTDGYIYVYDMKTLVRKCAMYHKCAVFAIASICIETAAFEGPSWMKTKPKTTINTPSKSNTTTTTAFASGSPESKTAEGEEADEDEDEGGPIGFLKRQSSSVSAAFASIDLMSTSSSMRPEQRMYTVSGGHDGKVCLYSLLLIKPQSFL